MIIICHVPVLWSDLGKSGMLRNVILPAIVAHNLLRCLIPGLLTDYKLNLMECNHSQRGNNYCHVLL